MKNYGMTLAFVTSLSLSFLGLSTGCADPSPAPEAGGEAILVNEENHTALPGAELRIERAASESTFSLVEGSDWRSVAPGVWELPSGDGHAPRIAVGEEGHRWLVEQADADLAALYARQDAGDVSLELEQKIAVAEGVLEAAQQSMKKAVGGPTPQALSCNIARYTGPSSPVTNPPVAGAAALAQIVCSGGCATFTVSSEACCDGWCSDFSSFTNTVCGTPWTAGTILSGYGAGYAYVNVNPPNITQWNSSFYCE